MSTDQEVWSVTSEKEPDHEESGFDPSTGLYYPILQFGDNYKIPTKPDLNAAAFVLSQFPDRDHAESKVAFIDSTTDQRLTYGQLHRSIHALASSLYHGLGVRKGDVVFLLAPNSLLYPTICLAVFSLGAILSPANPVNTESMAYVVLASGSSDLDENQVIQFVSSQVSHSILESSIGYNLVLLSEIIRWQNIEEGASIAKPTTSSYLQVVIQYVFLGMLQRKLKLL